MKNLPRTPSILVSFLRSPPILRSAQIQTRYAITVMTAQPFEFRGWPIKRLTIVAFCHKHAHVLLIKSSLRNGIN